MYSAGPSATAWVGSISTGLLFIGGKKCLRFRKLGETWSKKEEIKRVCVSK